LPSRKRAIRVRLVPAGNDIRAADSKPNLIKGDGNFLFEDDDALRARSRAGMAGHNMTGFASPPHVACGGLIIAEGKDTDGLYFYSKNEEACLRLIAI
jgi:hypothetical protein